MKFNNYILFLKWRQIFVSLSASVLYHIFHKSTCTWYFVRYGAPLLYSIICQQHIKKPQDQQAKRQQYVPYLVEEEKEEEEEVVVVVVEEEEQQQQQQQEK